MKRRLNMEPTQVYKKRKRSGKFTPKPGADKASLALATARLALRQNAPEVKYFDRNEDTILSMNTTGTLHNLCQPVQGDSVNERVGDSIKTKNLKIRFTVTNNSGQSRTQARVILFRYKNVDPSSGIAPANLLEGTAPFNTRTQKDWSNKFESLILYDETFALGEASDCSRVLVRDVRVNLGSKRTTFTPGTTTTEDNYIGILFLSDITAGSTVPSFQYRSRVEYTDA